MSGLFGSTTIPGNRITDFADQTATVGTPIPFGYGTFPVSSTNVIWIDKVVEHVTKKKQGKGGVKTEQYTYTRSYAIGVCQGPVYGFLIIRRNGKVVYTEDPNAPVEDKDYAAKWKQSATFYFGTSTQLPDSTIEAVEGAGQVSAFRDIAYFVVENDDVTDGGGAVPSYEVVVVGSAPEVYMTSRPYNLEATNSVQTDVKLTMVRPEDEPSISGQVSFSAAILDISLFGGSQNYSYGFESVTMGASLLDIALFGGSKSYTYSYEAATMGAELLDISLYGGAVNYSFGGDGSTENLSIGATLLEITLV